MTEIIDELQINTDGGARGNPGPAAIGVVAKAKEVEIFSLSERIGETTNNVAEYTAVIRALENIETLNLHVEKTRFILDSELIVRQIVGKYKVKQPHLQVLRQKIVELISKLRENKNLNLLSFTTVRREFNKQADTLVNEALDS